MIRMLFMSTTITVAAMISAVAPVSAQDEPRTERVSYADLDLAIPADASVFDSRVRRAIDRVCDIGGDQSISTMLEAGRCASRARANVKLQVLRVYAASGSRSSSAPLILAAH